MKITRDHFIDHFAISVGVHALKLWSLRSKEPPDHVARAMYETMRTCGGEFPIDSRRFSEIMQPVIAELHRITPQGQRPDAKDLTGRAYDALSTAGIEVTIRPPNQPHSNAR